MVNGARSVVLSGSRFFRHLGNPFGITSQHAILGLARSIAQDYSRYGLRCNDVRPGITDTPILHARLDATFDSEPTVAGRLDRVAIGVALTLIYVAKSVLFSAVTTPRE